MAGSGADQGFNGDEFRAAVRAAMAMATPSDPELQALFHWTEQRSFSTADPTGSPYDWTSTPATDTTHAEVKVPVAVEWAGLPNETGTDVGTFSAASGKLTLLDEDYAQIVGASTVLLGGKVYDIVSIPMPVALFDVTVWEIVVRARSIA